MKPSLQDVEVDGANILMHLTLLIGLVPFPPDVPPGPSFWPTHLAVAILCGGSVLGVLLRSARPARAMDLVIWLLIAPSGGLLFELSSVGHLVSREFRVMVTAFVAITAITGFVVTSLRFYQRDASPRVVFAAGCLATFVLITFLAAPATPTAREASRRTQCKNNLHQLGLALHNYVDLYQTLPAPIADADQVPRSWRVNLLPWVDQSPLRRRYQESAAWDSATNETVAKTDVPTYLCPSHGYPRDSRDRLYTSYAALSGDSGVFADDVRPGFPKTVGDGISQTLMLIEACGRQIVWTEPRDVDPAMLPLGINLDGERKGETPGLASSYHPGGFHATFADGSVRLLFETIDPKVLQALITANGSDFAGEF